MKLDHSKLSRILGLSIMTASELAVSYQVTGDAISQLSTKSVINELNRTSEYYGDSPYVVENKVHVGETENFSAHQVGGFITFDTSGTVAIHESEGCSSVTDAGLTEYIVNLDDLIENPICTFITSSPVGIKIVPDGSTIRVTTDRPYEGTIKLIFFEQLIDMDVQV